MLKKRERECKIQNGQNHIQNTEYEEIKRKMLKKMGKIKIKMKNKEWKSPIQYKNGKTHRRRKTQRKSSPILRFCEAYRAETEKKGENSARE